MERIKRFLGFPLEEEYKDSINESLAQYSYRIQRIVCIIVFLSQIIMLLTMALRPGGPFKTLRRACYCSMYFSLILATIYFVLWDYWFHIHNKSVRGTKYLRAAAIYMSIICLWSCGITLIDQLGGNGLSVYSYMILSIAAFSILQPWQGIALFGGSFIFLNSCLPFFKMGIHNLFSNIVNSLFISVLACIISSIFYRGRVFSFYDGIIIKKQYEEICCINQQLHKKVMIDDLTQMNNRRYLEEVIGERFQERRRHGIKAAGMMVDIDYFKQYNDNYGHQAGDDCLRHVAKIILDFIEQEKGCAVRYGGEEFFIFLFDCIEEKAVEKAETLRKAIEQDVFVNKDIYHDDTIDNDKKIASNHVTVSIGVYVENDLEKIELHEIVRRADMALYQAKRQSRNCVVLYSEICMEA